MCIIMIIRAVSIGGGSAHYTCTYKYSDIVTFMYRSVSHLTSPLHAHHVSPTTNNDIFGTT